MGTDENINRKWVAIALFAAVFAQWFTGHEYLNSLDAIKPYSNLNYKIIAGRLIEGKLGVSLTVLFGMAGVFGAVLTTRQLNMMRELSITQNEKIEKLTEIQTKKLETQSVIQARELQRITNQGIKSLEDATRHSLEGFPAIFARALWLLDKSTGTETYYVNFVALFGRAHIHNTGILSIFENEIEHNGVKNIIDTYTEDCNEMSYLEKGSVAFGNLLKIKAQRPKGKFTAILLNGEDAVKERFISRLPFLKNSEMIDDLYKQELLYRKDLASAVDATYRNAKADISKGFEIGFDKYITTQFLITKIKESSSGGRWGCLVFFIGTDNVGGVVPRGYYTELESMAMLHISQINELLGRDDQGTVLDGDKQNRMMNCQEWEAHVEGLLKDIV